MGWGRRRKCLSHITGVRGKVGSRRQSIVHEELTAIGVGNDLNLIGWKMTIFEAFRRGATMDHEPWPNCLFPIDRASASQRVSKVRSSLSWRLLLEELLLLGSASRHGFRTINLQGKSPRYRSEEHTSELQSPMYLVCRLLLEKKN